MSKSEPFFRWGRTGAEHRAHARGPIRDDAPGWLTDAANRHTRDTGCPCPVACRHEGFFGKRYFCSSCGKELVWGIGW